MKKHSGISRIFRFSNLFFRSVPDPGIPKLSNLLFPGFRIFKLAFLFFLVACKDGDAKKDTGSASADPVKQAPKPALTLKDANHLATLPFKCIDTEYPNTMQQVLYSEADIKSPKKAHPSFYGCFDWHSSVHGHWSLVKLLKMFPDLENAATIRQKLTVNLAPENVKTEVEYLKGKYNKSFERTYGWAWLLKLSEELHTWDDPLGKQLEKNLQPLTELLVKYFIEYLPKLDNPVRSGVHPNSAFGMAFAYDYAVAVGNDSLKKFIVGRAKDFFLKDTACQIGLEPEGQDIFSPCLEEIDIMRRVLPKDSLKSWVAKFLPQLADKSFKLDPGKVVDRTDGHLGHIDGLNFARAWCLIGLANDLSEYEHLRNIAYNHMDYSLSFLLGGDGGNFDASGHWLGSFAIYALNSIPENRK
jgi:hypothetical protein